MDETVAKIFAELEALTSRLNELDNGKFEEIRRQMASVAADSRVVVNVVEAHGAVIAKLERTLTRLDLRCPLMKPDTAELEAVKGEKNPETD